MLSKQQQETISSFDDNIAFKKRRVDKWTEISSLYEEKIKLLENERNKIKERHANLKQKQAKFAKLHGGDNVSNDDILTINAGGELMKVKRDTLVQIKGSTLEALFSGRWENQLLRDKDDHVFLDVNPDCFGIILLYLQELLISPPDRAPKLSCGTNENKTYFDDLIQSLGLGESNSNEIDSTIVKELDDSCVSSFFSFLEEDNIQGQMNLAYRGSRDGWTASNFHSKCDNKGATVTVIKSVGGFVFGGFADLPWTSSGGNKNSPKAFLFALKCYSGLPPTKMKQEPSSNISVYHHSCFGPSFGDGDIYIAINANTNNNYVDVGCSYECPVEQEESESNFLTGEISFQVEEIEVFSIDDTSIKKLSSKIKSGGKLTKKAEETELHNVTFDKLQGDLKVALEEEKKDLMIAWEAVTISEESFEREHKHLDYFLSRKEESDAIIHFDVGIHDKKMAVKRSTLGQFPQSVLAKQFNDDLWTFQKVHKSDASNNTNNNDDHQKKNKALFINYSEYCFGKVLDQL